MATRLAYNHRTKQFTIHAAEGNLEAIPNKRSWKLKVYGVKIDKVIMTVNDDDHEVKGQYDEILNVTAFEISEMSVTVDLQIYFEGIEVVDTRKIKLDKITDFLHKAQTYNKDKERLFEICRSDKSEVQIISDVMSFSANPEIINPILEILLA